MAHEVWVQAQVNEGAWWKDFVGKELGSDSRDFVVGYRQHEGRLAMTRVGFPWDDWRYSSPGSPMQGRWLDVGCGPVSFFECDHAGLEVVAVDPLLARYAEELPGIAQLGRVRNCTYVAGQIHDVSGPFEVVWCYNVLDHTGDPQAIIQAAASRLQPGGMFLLGTDVRNGWSDQYHISPFTPDDLLAWCGAAGLYVRWHSEIQPFPPHPWKYFFGLQAARA